MGALTSGMSCDSRRYGVPGRARLSKIPAGEEPGLRFQGGWGASLRALPTVLSVVFKVLLDLIWGGK